jgi:hypothetical protein
LLKQFSQNVHRSLARIPAVRIRQTRSFPS